MSVTLGDIAKTQLCYIYMDRNDVLQVKSIKTLTSPKTVFSDDNQIISCSVNQTLLQEYSTVTVTYCNKSISDNTEMIALKEQTVNAGVNELDNLIIENGPMFLPAHCLVEGIKNAYVSSITYTPWDISLSITNTHNKEQNVDLTVYGSLINTNAKSYINGSVPHLVNRMGELPLEISGEYLDSEDHAKIVRDTMMAYISNPTPTIELITRGNPSIGVGDVVTVDNATNKIYKDVVVLRQDFSFNDGLECNMLCLDKSILTRMVM